MADHNPNKRQQAAFEKVVKAFEKARETGLTFYAKQGSLIAYNKPAFEYEADLDEYFANGEGCVIPFLNSDSCIQDSGADDYARYISLEDEKKFNKYSELND